MQKPCNVCGETKPLDDFYKHPQGLLGRMHRCKETEAEGVSQAARRALDEADGDPTRAAEILEERVRADQDLWRRLTDQLIRAACTSYVRSEVAAERRRIWRNRAANPRNVIMDGKRRMERLAQENLMLFPLPGGMRLGEARRDEVSAAAGFYAGMTRDMAWKQRWLSLVAQSLPDDKAVGEVLTEERLRELQAETQDNENG